MSQELNPYTGMTADEHQVVAFLEKALGAWRSQDSSICIDDMEGFVRAINQAKRVIAMRVVRRTYPEYWT